MHSFLRVLPPCDQGLHYFPFYLHLSRRRFATFCLNYKVTTAIVAHSNYNIPKFSDRSVWANSADPDQTAYIGAV